jgi:glutathione peroxidase
MPIWAPRHFVWVLSARPESVLGFVDSVQMFSTLKMYLRRNEKLAQATDLYRHKVGLLEGGELDLATLHGNPTLIVNTASKCGFTPQYAGLQELYRQYHEQGLQVLGCPSADFAGQEFDDSEQIGAFCERNYGVAFPLSERMSVRADPDPLWRDINRQPGSGPPTWNFTKYLIDRDGRLLGRWSSKVKPEDPRLVEAIKAALDRA